MAFEPVYCLKKEAKFKVQSFWCLSCNLYLNDVIIVLFKNHFEFINISSSSLDLFYPPSYNSVVNSCFFHHIRGFCKHCGQDLHVCALGFALNSSKRPPI